MKFQSSNSLLKSFHFFANPFDLWDNLNYFRFKAWFSCLKKPTCLRTDSFYEIPKNFQTFKTQTVCLKTQILRTGSVYEITWNFLKFQSSNSLPKQLHFLQTDSINEITWYYSKFQSLDSHLNLKSFSRADSVIYITWNLQLEMIAEKLQLFRKPFSSMKKLERIQTFKAQIFCPETSIFSRTNSAYELTWIISDSKLG